MRARKKVTFISESFDDRTLANMEVALERACETLSASSEKHEARRHIANQIVKCAAGGATTLSSLTKAGQIAASEICETHDA